MDPWVLVWPLLAAEATDTNTIRGCNRTTEPDVALGYSLGLNVTVTSDGKVSHPDKLGPSSSMVPRH